jgi:malonyl-CoA O-methyltransferase
MDRKPVIAPEDVLKQFSGAADRYNDAARLQEGMAWRLASHCRHLCIPRGLWVDLGSGTGRLADALEATHPGQSVLRVDGSAAMLQQQHTSTTTLQWDLSRGLPPWPQQPQLLCSSFALHWLPNPVQSLRTWIQSLQPGGWLVLAVPVEGSFPQWHAAAAAAEEHCTALPLPVGEQLTNTIPPGMVQRQQLLQFSQTGGSPASLLKPMIDIGAGSTTANRLPPGAWRRIFKAWPRGNVPNRFALSWRIQLLILNR